MREWTIRLAWKATRSERGTGVRIPLPPPYFRNQKVMLSSTFVTIWGLVTLALSVISVYKIKKNSAECDYIWWWAFPIGAFVWEDVLVFGLLHAVLAGLALYLRNPEIWLVFFLIFWLIRSAGETLYFFLQQFIQPKHHPHYIDSHFVVLRKVFGNISEQKCFIIMQVTMQTITVLSAIGLVLILFGN